MTEVLRTPDTAFDGLPGYGFAPHYAENLEGYEGLRVHYVDEGKGDETFLCLHGQPTWSYLYRRMIPIFAKQGRVIAPDWLGFGKSDKPASDDWYSFHKHRYMMLAFIDQLDLKRITLVVQDWGGLLGLTLPMDMPERFERLIIMNTALATGRKPSDGFMQWRAYAAANPDLDIATLMQRSCPHLSEAEALAYAAPYPDMSYKAGVRRFPNMVMVEPDMEGVETSKRAAQFWREEWSGKSFMAVGEQDPVLGVDVMQAMAKLIRGGPDPYLMPQAGHFVQEWGEEVAKAALAHFAKA
jgi:pimeloyl-ACP methyl ester carboxylesterase